MEKRVGFTYLFILLFACHCIWFVVTIPICVFVKQTGMPFQYFKSYDFSSLVSYLHTELTKQPHDFTIHLYHCVILNIRPTHFTTLWLKICSTEEEIRAAVFIAFCL